MADPRPPFSAPPVGILLKHGWRRILPPTPSGPSGPASSEPHHVQPPVLVPPVLSAKAGTLALRPFLERPPPKVLAPPVQPLVHPQMPQRQAADPPNKHLYDAALCRAEAHTKDAQASGAVPVDPIYNDAFKVIVTDAVYSSMTALNAEHKKDMDTLEKAWQDREKAMRETFLKALSDSRKPVRIPKQPAAPRPIIVPMFPNPTFQNQYNDYWKGRRAPWQPQRWAPPLWEEAASPKKRTPITPPSPPPPRRRQREHTRSRSPPWRRSRSRQQPIGFAKRTPWLPGARPKSAATSSKAELKSGAEIQPEDHVPVAEDDHKSPSTPTKVPSPTTPSL